MEALGIWGANRISMPRIGMDTTPSHQSEGWTNMISPATSTAFTDMASTRSRILSSFTSMGVQRTASWSDALVMKACPPTAFLSAAVGGWDNNNAGAQVNNQVPWMWIGSGLERHAHGSHCDGGR